MGRARHPHGSEADATKLEGELSEFNVGATPRAGGPPGGGTPPGGSPTRRRTASPKSALSGIVALGLANRQRPGIRPRARMRLAEHSPQCAAEADGRESAAFSRFPIAAGAASSIVAPFCTAFPKAGCCDCGVAPLFLFGSAEGQEIGGGGGEGVGGIPGDTIPGLGRMAAQLVQATLRSGRCCCCTDGESRRSIEGGQRIHR